LINDPKFLTLGDTPFSLRPHSSDTLVRSRDPNKLRSIPDDPANVQFPVQHFPNRRMAPSRPPVSRLWARCRNAFLIERPRDFLERDAIRRQLENSTDDSRLRFVYGKNNSLVVAEWDVVVPENAPAGVSPSQHSAVHAPVSFLGEFLNIQAVHHAVHSNKHLSLLMLGVNPLADGDKAHASETQFFEHAQGICGVTR
jgi:hypothetical protein